MCLPAHPQRLLAVAVLLLASPTVALAEAPEPRAIETAIVGIVIGGEEVGTLEVVRREDEYALPLEPLAELSRLTVEPTEDGTRLVTPLGAVELAADELEVISNVVYLPQSTLEQRLATPSEFDSAAFSLHLDLPWRTDLPPPPPVAEPRTADFGPPDASFSTLRTEIAVSGNRDRQAASATTTLGGRLADGFWRLRYDDDFSGSGELREASWLHTRGNRRTLLGQQRASVHPLLGSVELAGAQLAFTNQPRLFSQNPERGELLSRRLQPQAQLQGAGPPAGVAELRIDGEVVAQQVIGLDGIYRFFDVPLATRRLSEVEVLLYDRHNLAVPVAVHRETRSASDLILPHGAVIQRVGVGRSGNLLQDPDADSRLTGFYQWRYGLRPGISLEAAVQDGPRGRQAVAGFVSRLGLGSVMSLAVAGSSDGLAYDFTLETRWRDWRWLGQSRLAEAGFRGSGSEATFDHVFELGYRRAGLDVALIGRSSRETVNGEARREQYLLPALYWLPFPRLSLRARPDRFGDYRFELGYRFAPSARLALSYRDRLSMSLSYRFRQRYTLTVDSDFGDSDRFVDDALLGGNSLLGGELADSQIAERALGSGTRHSAVLRWFTGGSWRPDWSVGALATDDTLGYLLAASARVRSGIRGRFEARSLTGRSDDLQVSLSLTADLALAGGRLFAGRRGAVRNDRGAIAGRLRVEGVRDARTDLRGLQVFIDGRPAAKTQAGGSFLIGRLEPGIYRVELDDEHLPIELSLERRAFTVRVAAASVTRLEFAARPEYGVAGRLTDASGITLDDRWIELLDADGQLVDLARTDRFGLYRFDGLAVGEYRLRVVTEETVSKKPTASRAIRIVDDFLFGQDLVLPVP